MYSTLSYKGVGGVQTHIDALCLLFYIFESILGRSFSMSDEAGGQVMIASCWGTTTQTEGLAAGGKVKVTPVEPETLCTLYFLWILSDLICLGTVLTNWSIFSSYIITVGWIGEQQHRKHVCFPVFLLCSTQDVRDIVWLYPLCDIRTVFYYRCYDRLNPACDAHIQYNKLYNYSQKQQINMRLWLNRGFQKKSEHVILLQDERSVKEFREGLSVPVLLITSYEVVFSGTGQVLITTNLDVGRSPSGTDPLNLKRQIQESFFLLSLTLYSMMECFSDFFVDFSGN